MIRWGMMYTTPLFHHFHFSHKLFFRRETMGHKVSSYNEFTSIYIVVIFCHAKSSSYKQVKINKIGKLVSKIGCLYEDPTRYISRAI